MRLQPLDGYDLTNVPWYKVLVPTCTSVAQRLRDHQSSPALGQGVLDLVSWYWYFVVPPYPPPRDQDLKLGPPMFGRGVWRRWPMVYSRIPSHLFLYCFISLHLQLIFSDFESQNLSKINPKSTTKLDAHWTCFLFRIFNVFLQDSLWTSNLSAYWNLSKHLCFTVKMQMQHFLYDVTCCYVVY